MTEYAFEGVKRSSTSISWSFATSTLGQDVFVPFSGPIGAAYQATVIAALARWASVSGLTFTQVADGSSVPIRIGFGAFTSSNELGETDYRSSGGLLSNDTLIRLLDPASVPVSGSSPTTLTYAAYGITMFQVALHEIGHALGLNHTTDPLTVMYPYASTSDQDLAQGDIWGINTLYPLFTVTSPNAVQAEGGAGQTDTFSFVVTRYSDPSLSLSIGYSVVGVASPGLTGSVAATASAFAGGAFPSGTLTFQPGAQTATLTVTTVGNTTAQPDEGFAIALTAGTASVVVRGSTAATILDDDGFGQIGGSTLGVYRFFDQTDGTQFLSSSQTERNTLLQSRPELTYEGVGLRAVATPAADAASVPVFRFFDTMTGTHFYSSSATERDMLVATRLDLRLEGTAFYEDGTAQSGDVPVYRFFETRDGTHFYTSSASERATVGATRPDLVYEGIAFYAPST